MTPRGIAEKAASLGINIIAVCDHNSAENVEAVMNVGRQRGIRVMAGMEITSAEEVHVLGLFGDLDSALRMQKAVYERLQPGENDEETFGMQVVVNELDEVMAFNRRLLIGATSLSVNECVDTIHRNSGIAIASHIDREGFGIIGQLGFIPPDIRFDALEISGATGIDEARRRYSEYAGVPWVTASDAHQVKDIGRRTIRLFMHHATFEEFSLAVRGADGRRIIL